MHHLVVGGNGFLGQHLVRALSAEGHCVSVVDIARSDHEFYGKVPFYHADLTDPKQLANLPRQRVDVIHHLAAKLIVPNYPRVRRREYFWACIFSGTENLLACMRSLQCDSLIYWSSDMVYGPVVYSPRDEKHPRQPLGPYGIAKAAAEDLCMAHRQKGINVTIFRPRLIIGPGRLGILEKLFKLIRNHLPVPVIGDGSNCFQFVSVYDCAAASVSAAERGVPNAEYNLGSVDSPTVADLLGDLIRRANSRSKIIRTPGSMAKTALRALNGLGIGLMDPEQFEIADQEVRLDVSAAQRDLHWHPRYDDRNMMVAAYEAYLKRPSAWGAT